MVRGRPILSAAALISSTASPKATPGSRLNDSVVQAIGKTTMLLSMLEAGDSILDVVGPLGKPSEIEKFGTTVVVSGSVGTAMAYPTARELKRAGNKVISI